MSKRQADNEASNSRKMLKNSPENTIPELPVEIIMKIISYLNDVKDLKNCMELSKGIRHLLLKTPRIWKKFERIVLESNAKKEKVSEFLTNYGSNITTLKIEGREIEQQLLSFILKNVPNLEELTFEPSITLHRSRRTFELPNLRRLTFLNDNFDSFLKYGRKLENLESLSLRNHRNDDDELLTDFVVKLDKLKELNLIYHYYKHNPEDFPTRDIRSEVKFKLTSFSHSLNNHPMHPDNENFFLFFASQAKHLKQVKLYGDQNIEIYDILFRQCKNLEKLTVHKSEYSEDSPFFSEPNELVLESVKHFESGNLEDRDLEYIYGNLPNLKSLSCITMYGIEGTFEKLEKLKVYRLSSPELKLPNLKSIICEEVEDLTDIAPNIEELKMLRRYISDSEHLMYLNILKSLKSLNKLLTFEAEFYNSNSESDFKITMDMVEKKASVTSHLLDDYKEFSDIFRDSFSDFDFYYYENPNASFR